MRNRVDREKVIAENESLIAVLTRIYQAKYRREAIRVVLDEQCKSDRLDASFFGTIRLALPGENWPYFDNKPMLPLCQINVAGLSFRPPTLEDTSFLTYFCCDGDWLPVDNHINGSCWVIRTYSDMKNLGPVNTT
jgi:hypothetical protein